MPKHTSTLAIATIDNGLRTDQESYLPTMDQLSAKCQYQLMTTSSELYTAQNALLRFSGNCRASSAPTFCSALQTS